MQSGVSKKLIMKPSGRGRGGGGGGGEGGNCFLVPVK